jgi:hypothetical protein
MAMEHSNCKLCKSPITILNGIRKSGTSKEFANICKFCFKKKMTEIKLRKIKQKIPSMANKLKIKISWLMGHFKSIYYKLDKTIEKLER